MSNPIDWQTLSAEERDKLVHERIMGLSIEPCKDGEINIRYGGYWECSCGWMSPETLDHYDDGPFVAHDRPIPAYSTDMSAALSVLKYAVQVEVASDKETLTYELFGTTWGDLSAFQAIDIVCTWTPVQVCLAVLIAVGMTIT